MKKLLTICLSVLILALCACTNTTTSIKPTLEATSTLSPSTSSLTTAAPTTSIAPSTNPFNSLSYEGYKLYWSDEFDGSSLNEENWNYQLGNGSAYGIAGWGNNEKQLYDEESTSVSGGTLKITAQKTDGVINSSRLTTLGKVEVTYGIIEAKIKLPSGQGFWPAFWLLPASDTPYGSWPQSGEIDIMEAKGRLVNESSSAVHVGVGTTHKYFAQSQTFKNSGAITDFHTYALVWTSETMHFYVDGELTFELLSWDNRFNKYDMPAPFDTNFYIILNLAVGGTFDQGLEPLDEDYPGIMEVDYVRIYQKEE